MTNVVNILFVDNKNYLFSDLPQFIRLNDKLE